MAAFIISCSSDDSTKKESSSINNISIKSSAKINDSVSKIDIKKISKDKYFIDFANIYFNTIIEQTVYQHTILKTTQQVAKLKTELAGVIDPDKIDEIYKKYRLNPDKMYSFYLRIQQAQLDMLWDSPSIDQLPPAEMDAALADLLLQSYRNGDIKIDSTLMNQLNATFANGGGILHPWEVWSCLEDAVTGGIVSFIGMHGIKALGIKVLTKMALQIIGKVAGPLAVAYTIADFSFCLMEQAADD